MGTGGVVAGEGWREAWSLKKMEGGVVTEGWRKAWSQKDGGRGHTGEGWRRRGHRRRVPGSESRYK